MNDWKYRCVVCKEVFCLADGGCPCGVCVAKVGPNGRYNIHGKFIPIWEEDVKP